MCVIICMVGDMMTNDKTLKSKPQSIITERLVMKSISGEDWKDIKDIFSSKEVSLTYMLPVFNDEEDMVKLFVRFIALSKDDGRFVYGIYLDDKLIGFVNDVEMTKSEIELGYVINPHFKGNGYATEVLIASISTLFDMGFKVVKTGAFIENKASLRVMEKAGMTKIDYEDEVPYNGQLHKCAYYQMKVD